MGLIEEKSEGIVDSSGFETRHASRHYRIRIKEKFNRDETRGWPKVSIACDKSSHLVVSAVVTPGPSADFGFFIPVLTQASKNVTFDRVLADKGYDSEINHRIAREELKIRSTVIPTFKRRGGKDIPLGKYRRQMALHFQNSVYKSRSQVECVFSRVKRVLGPWVKAKKWDSQERECHLKLLTFNFMLIAGAENA